MESSESQTENTLQDFGFTINAMKAEVDLIKKTFSQDKVYSLEKTIAEMT